MVSSGNKVKEKCTAVVTELWLLGMWLLFLFDGELLRFGFLVQFVEVPFGVLKASSPEVSWGPDGL